MAADFHNPTDQYPKNVERGTITHMARPPTSPRTEADQVQVELFRQASPAKRLARCRSLSSSVIILAKRAIRDQNPNMSDDDVNLEFVSLHYGPELALKLRQHLENR